MTGSIQSSGEPVKGLYFRRSRLPPEYFPVPGGALLAESMCGKPRRVKQMSSS